MIRGTYLAYGRNLVGAFRKLQDDIVAALERVDGSAFRQDQWDRPGGGGAIIAG